MGLKRFDRKFGADLVRELPTSPGVYLFKDAHGAVLYAGKAKNIRRRLQGYRNASRRKAHRKMRTLVSEASTLEVHPQDSEREALLLENQLIRELRPPFNVDGAYAFLYPAIGLARRPGQVLLCFTTRTDAFEGFDFQWFGVFRPRHRARDAFDALAALLAHVGHREPGTRLRDLPRYRGTVTAGFRRVEPLVPDVCDLLAGRSPAVLARIAESLVEAAGARRDAEQVGADLRCLEAFHRDDAVPLRKALAESGAAGCFVPQDERDALFIAQRVPE